MDLLQLLHKPIVVVPELHQIRAANLEGWVYGLLSEEHPYHVQLRAVVLARLARHGLIRQKMIDLCKLWNAVGIEPLVVKGFALAEFFYPLATQRFYGDVDVLVPLDQAKVAADIAQENHWLENANISSSPNIYRHEYCHLYSIDRVARIDLHTELLQSSKFDLRRIKFSKAIDSMAETRVLNGARFRVPTPVDMALLMLQNRRWGDRWGRKPSDYLDLLVLKDHFSLTREVLLSRAKDLGCLRSTQLALETCDPWLCKSDLRVPTFLGQVLLDLQCHSDLGFRILELVLDRSARIPRRLLEVAKLIPILSYAKKMIKESTDLNVLVGKFDVLPISSLAAPFYVLENIEVSAKWAIRLLGPKFNPCVPKSLMLFNALSKKGFAVSFVSGVRKANGKLEGHAWVEVNGLPLESEMQSPGLFKENFRYDNYLLRQRKAMLEQKV